MEARGSVRCWEGCVYMCVGIYFLASLQCFLHQTLPARPDNAATGLNRITISVIWTILFNQSHTNKTHSNNLEVLSRLTVQYFLQVTVKNLGQFCGVHPHGDESSTDCTSAGPCNSLYVVDHTIILQRLDENIYRKVVYESRGLCAIFQLFGAASIQVRLLFEGGLHAKSRVYKTRKSGLAHVKWKWNLTLRLLQYNHKCKQIFTCEKWQDFVIQQRPQATFFELRLLFECSLCATKVRRKCSFY